MCAQCQPQSPIICKFSNASFSPTFTIIGLEDKRWGRIFYMLLKTINANPTQYVTVKQLTPDEEAHTISVLNKLLESNKANTHSLKTYFGTANIPTITIEQKEKFVHQLPHMRQGYELCHYSPISYDKLIKQCLSFNHFVEFTSGTCKKLKTTTQINTIVPQLKRTCDRVETAILSQRSSLETLQDTKQAHDFSTALYKTLTTINGIEVHQNQRHPHLFRINLLAHTAAGETNPLSISSKGFKQFIRYWLHERASQQGASFSGDLLDWIELHRADYQFITERPFNGIPINAGESLDRQYKTDGKRPLTFMTYLLRTVKNTNPKDKVFQKSQKTFVSQTFELTPNHDNVKNLFEIYLRYPEKEFESWQLETDRNGEKKREHAISFSNFKHTTGGAFYTFAERYLTLSLGNKISSNFLYYFHSHPCKNDSKINHQFSSGDNRTYDTWKIALNSLSKNSGTTFFPMPELILSTYGLSIRFHRSNQKAHGYADYYIPFSQFNTIAKKLQNNEPISPDCYFDKLPDFDTSAVDEFSIRESLTKLTTPLSLSALIKNLCETLQID